MASIDPKTGTLGRRLAAHLLRRVSYGPTRSEIEAFASKSVEEAVSELLTFPPLPQHPIDPKTGETWVVEGRTIANSSTDDLKPIVNSWWLHQIFDPANGISAFCKLTYFLHMSFTTSWEVLDWSENHYYTLRLLMFYAPGSYKDLAKKICLDNGMNTYLDIGESLKGNPNENFAREFFELFTIGKGPQIGDGNYTNFTEEDIRAAAKIFTGFRRNDNWSDPEYIDLITGLPTAKPTLTRHDTSDKTFSSAFQNTTIPGRLTELGMVDEINDLVEMIFAQRATALTICRRLYRFFVKNEITEEVETDIIQALATTLIDNDYALIPVLSQMLSSQHFYDEDDTNAEDKIIGGLIKSPLDLQAGIIRYFKVPVPDPSLDPYESYVNFFKFGMQDRLSAACFDLFAPPDVAGHEPHYQAPDFNRLWISAKSLPARYSIVDEHLEGPDFMRFDVMAFVENIENIPDFEGPDPLAVPGPHPGPRIAQHLVEQLVYNLLPEEISNDRFSYFLNQVLLDDLSELNWANEWDEYKFSGDDTNVRQQITKLIRAILQSPEFQLG